MGREGSRVGGLPVSLKVKNTFIDVNSSFVEDDAEGDDVAFVQTGLRARQVSEPVPGMQRQISGGLFCRGGAFARSPVAAGIATDSLLLREEAEGDELDEDEEPETEKDPSWLLGRQELGRQETDPTVWPSFTMGRQETEQLWPSWTMPTAPAFSSEDVAEAQDTGASAADMWMYQMHSLDGGQAVPPADSTGRQLPTALAPSPWPGLVDSCGGAYPADASTAPAPQDNAMGMASAAMDGLEVPPAWAETSTVMMRNLPNKYTQQMLLEELNQSGFNGTFDFMYLPIDPETHANRGYAFINFIDPSFAWMLKMTYEGRQMNRFNSDKVVSVAPAALQGFEANYAHYSTARVNRGDPAARPLFLCESRLRHVPPKHDSGRRRGGRRNSGSLIDMAAKRQQQQVSMVGPTRPPQQRAPAAAAAAMPMQAGLGGGSLFSDDGAADGGADLKGAAAPSFCPYCGGKCQPQFRFCQFCGASLSLCF